jgi:peptidoglycan/xylan/chitin deacetylase (PgdA/CDA1 family)
MKNLLKTAMTYITLALLTVFSFLPAAASAAGTNLVLNPSAEVASVSNVNAPSNWSQGGWGTNTAAYTWQNTGKDGNRSLGINVTKYTNGDAKWMSDVITVAPNTKYQLSDWYISNVQTSLELAYIHANGSTTYAWLKDAAASTAWKQVSGTFTTPTDVSKVTVYHVLAKKGTLQTDAYELVNTSAPTPPPTPPTAPSVNLTAPVNGSTVSGTQAVTATASDAVGVSGVQFKVDGNNLGTEDTVAPYTVNLDSKTLANGSHTVSATARNAANLTATATAAVTVNNIVTPPAPTPPTVTLTAPANNATVSGTQAITASANDAVSVSGVQFKVDGTNFGSEDTSAPYSTNLDTTTLANGNHTISAVARNNSNLTATATVTVNINNVVTPPTPPTPPATPNLIANPSVETAETATKPTAWNADGWGTNTVQFSYLNTGRTGTRSLKTDVTAYTSGDAKWYFADAGVTAGKTYSYSNWYQSNVDSEVDAAVTMQDGSVQYYYLTTASASASWKQVSAQFTAPVNAKTITIFQVLAKKGFVVSDDFSLTEYTPVGFNRAMVSLTFDDGWRSQYDNALPILTKYGMSATFYLLTETVDYPDYMTVGMMQNLKNAGHELDSHTISHPHLPQLTIAKIDNELSQSQAQLRQWFGASVADDFASPYGEYNATTLTEIKKFYRSHRSTDEGFNSKDNFDIYNIKVQNILNTTPASQVKAWVEQSQREHTWLVLVYHEVATAVEDPTYSISPADLDAQLAAIKANGIAVRTVGQALDEIKAQQ